MAYDINKTFPIYQSDGTTFHDLVIRKATIESTVMSLGDKISGDVYYKDNTLVFTMREYIMLDGVKYVLVNPPTVVREGTVRENSQLKGMTKYSLVFYHPMYMLGNFPFSDIAVTESEEDYLAQNKTFSWIGNLFDFIAKLNANLEQTEWFVETNITASDEEKCAKATKMSEVLSFDKQFIADALKTAYETWEIPFTITNSERDIVVDEQVVHKRFLIEFGLPTQEILDSNNEPFVFRLGQGVGLKNNSRTPRNNKIITRLVGSGSERNIPFGYPQIRWWGNQEWKYTINNDPTAQGSYPIYEGIVSGEYVKLIKHPFTRKTLMPSVYVESVFNKVSPYLQRALPSGSIVQNPNYNRLNKIIDYYDAVSTESVQYPNPINPSAPSVEIHQFEDIYPRLDEQHIVEAYPINASLEGNTVVAIDSIDSYKTYLNTAKEASQDQDEQSAIQGLIDFLTLANTKGITIPYYAGNTGDGYKFNCVVQQKGTGYQGVWVVNYTSDSLNITNKEIIENRYQDNLTWDDTLDENGEYVQSYFKIKLPQLHFDIYACASITEKMQINMRSGACAGCTFDIQVDWEDYKKNFYDSDKNFDPAIGTGHPRNAERYPDSSQGQIEVIVKKDLDTFGTLMPNIYQSPKGVIEDVYDGDTFVVLGISLPSSYIKLAQEKLDAEMKNYMLENNVYYYDYPLKFDEFFLTTHQDILAQIRNNSIVRFDYAGTELELYIKQISVKYGESVLPQWNITLTDNIDVVLNKIGQAIDGVGKIQAQLENLENGGASTSVGTTGIPIPTRGDVGKFFYYAGEWSDDTDKKWNVTDRQAPYFSYTDQTSKVVTYWVFLPDSNGTYTQHDMGVPSIQNGWEVVNNSFNYLITEAVFGKYAHFGAAIINGDWQLSQYGVLYDKLNTAYAIVADTQVTIDDVVYDYSNAYTMFDPSYPNSSKPGEVNFAPNFCLDMKRGWTYQNVAEVNGVFKSRQSSDGSATYIGAAMLSFGYRNADIFSISCEGSGASRNVKMIIGASDTGMTYFDIESRGTFQGSVTSMITLHNMEGGTNVPSIVIHKGGIAMTNSDGSSIYAQKTWGDLLGLGA